MEKQDRITLNIGGSTFITCRSTLDSIPGSLLSTLSENSEFFNQTDNVFYFDRDSEIFAYILNAHRTGILHVPSNRCPTSVEVELDIWRIPREILSECCWKTFYQSKGDLETISKLKSVNGFRFGLSLTKVASEILSEKSTKEKIWLFLEEPASSKAARAWHMFYGFLVVVSTLTFLLWAEASMRVKGYMPSALSVSLNAGPATYNERVLLLLFTDPHPVLFGIDICCILFFFAECVVHIAVSPTKGAFFRCKFNSCNSILIITMTVALSLEVTRGLINNKCVAILFYVLKTFTVFRLLLLFKLQKLYSGLRILLLSMAESWRELLLLVVCYAIAVIIFGGLMFCVDIEANNFKSIFSAMWWALITMTTVGYGDFYPTVAPTYAIGCLCATLGIVILALPIAIIASNFSDFFHRNNDIELHLDAIANEKIEKKALNDTITDMKIEDLD